MAPDELAYIDGTAWNDIMGHRKQGQGENGKDPIFWKSQQHSVIGADRENHTRMRRTLAHGFSAQAMMDQQPLENSDYHPWVSLIFTRVRTSARNNVLRRFPFGEKLIQLLVSKQDRQKFQEHYQLTKEKVNKRLAETSPRADFMEVMTKKEGAMV